MLECKFLGAISCHFSFLSLRIANCQTQTNSMKVFNDTLAQPLSILVSEAATYYVLPLLTIVLLTLFAS